MLLAVKLKSHNSMLQQHCLIRFKRSKVESNFQKRISIRDHKVYVKKNKNYIVKMEFTLQLKEQENNNQENQLTINLLKVNVHNFPKTI